MTDIFLVILINFFSVYMAVQYYGVLKKEHRRCCALYLLPFFLLWAVLNVCCFFLVRDVRGILEPFCAVAAGVILLCETVIVFQKEEAWKEQMRRRDYLTSRQLQYYARQYETLSHFQETMRRERHERKNRNLELLMLAQKGELQELISCLKEEQQLLVAPGGSPSTGNCTIDAVLGFEQAMAQEKGIRVDRRISVPSNLEAADSILCGILGNALDNAIEACGRLPEPERVISVFMKVERKNLFIEVRNRYDGTILTGRDGQLLSRKENRQEHGMGLRIIRELLERADGSVETDWDEQYFTLRMILYHVI